MPSLHYLTSNEIVLAIDFANARVLVGALTRNRDPKSVYRHYRYTLARTKWHREVHDTNNAAIDAEGWRRAKGSAGECATLKCTYVPVHLLVDRGDLTKAVASIRKLIGKSIGFDSLVTVHVHAAGLTLVSHGPQRMVVDVKSKDEQPATDGLGSVVMYGEALKQLLKDVSTDPLVSVQRGPDGGTCLAIGSSLLWTVDSPAVAVQAVEAEPVDVGLTAAIERALVFASTDEARPNLHCVNLRGFGDHVDVCTTDGHRLYRERVKCSALGTRSYTIARGVLTSLRSGKRTPPYRFAFADDGACTVACDGKVVRCERYGYTFPPYNQILPADLAERPSVALTGEQIDALRKWVDAQPIVNVGTSGNIHPIRITTVQVHAGARALQFTATHDGKSHAIECDVLDALARPYPTERDPEPAFHKWAVSPTYLGEVLASLAGEKVVKLHANGELEPLFFFSDSRVGLLMLMY